MLRLFFPHPWLVYFLTGIQFFTPCLAFPESQGLVSYEIEWGSFRHTYTYIFSGTVHCGKELCENARVRVQVEPENYPGAAGETRTSSNGQFELQIACEGSADDSAVWKIIADTPLSGGGDPVELEGRIIMTEDQTTVVVQRPVHISRG